MERFRLTPVVVSRWRRCARRQHAAASRLVCSLLKKASALLQLRLRVWFVQSEPRP